MGGVEGPFRAEPATRAGLASESRESLESQSFHSYHSSDSLALSSAFAHPLRSRTRGIFAPPKGTCQPLVPDTAAFGGPSTPPMISRSAQDDRFFTALAL